MKLNPEAIIQAGSVGGAVSGGTGGGACGAPGVIDSKYWFRDNQERDAYFNPDHLDELQRLKTFIIVGSELQLWTGETKPDAYNNTLWNVTTWVIAGPEGAKGDPGKDGIGIRKAIIVNSPDQKAWVLTIVYTEGNDQVITVPYPPLITDLEARVEDIEHRFNSDALLTPDLDIERRQGRFAVNSTTLNRPALLSGVTFVDVYNYQDATVQELHTIQGQTQFRVKVDPSPWTAWRDMVGSSGGGGGGINPILEAIIESLNQRFAVTSAQTPNLDAKTEQGRFCFDVNTVNRPPECEHGSVDVHACKDHIIQFATGANFTTYIRVKDINTGVWSEWKETAGKSAITDYPSVSTLFTTDVQIHNHMGQNEFYIPWKYISDDNYGCTVFNSQDYWKCPKPGNYSFELFFTLSHIKTTDTIPTMTVIEVYKTSVATGTESKISTYEIANDTSKKDQDTFTMTTLCNDMLPGDMIRYKVIFVGASWSEADNPDVAILPYRTMLAVDEVGKDTSLRKANGAYYTWANFQSIEGYAAIAGPDATAGTDAARIRGYKWNQRKRPINAKP